MGIFSRLKRINTLYYPGCIAYFRDKKEYYCWIEIFNKLGIDHKLSDKNICCGLPAIESGYSYEARKLARRNFEIFKESKIDKIIAPCPVCYKMFLIDYREFLPDWNIEIINIWKVISDKLSDKPGLIKVKSKDSIGFLDSCYLGRYSGVYSEPREILKSIGYEIIEMSDNFENSICSGSCGGLPRMNQELAIKSAKERLLQAKRVGIKNLVVMSLEEYDLLNISSKDTNIEILFFTDLLADSLGIKKEDINELMLNDSANKETKEDSTENIENKEEVLIKDE
jgi:Fe-S oxidoreductase